jgi:hypothetical protein
MKQTIHPVEVARGHVDRWTAEVARLEGELASRERTIGADALKDPDSLAGSARALAELRDQVAGARAALEHARKALAAAEKASGLEEVATLKARAEELFVEADRHQVRTRVLLGKVAEHEEVDAWSDQPAGQLIQMVRVVPLTKSDLLRSEARKLQKAADDLHAALTGSGRTHLLMVRVADGYAYEYRGR